MQPMTSVSRGATALVLFASCVLAQQQEDVARARALYDAMIAAFRAPTTLSYRASHVWRAGGKEIGTCTYTVRLQKPNRFRVDAARRDGKVVGVLIGDGEDLWIHWPGGKPHFHTEDPAELRDPDRDAQYLRKAAPPGGHSIGHEMGLLGVQMAMPVFDPSTFHGYTDSLQPYLDGVEYEGTETVRGENCDVLAVSFMKGQRTWTLWVAQGDHLPRRLRQDLAVREPQVVDEEWTDVEVDADLGADLFAWQPPPGWRRWYLPSAADRLPKPGSKAPDFELTLASGAKVRLSDHRGKVVWLNIWRVG